MTPGADKRNDGNTQAMLEYCKRGSDGKILCRLKQGCAKIGSQFCRASTFCGA